MLMDVDVNVDVTLRLSCGWEQNKELNRRLV